MVEQHSSHLMRGDGEELRAILPLDPSLTSELQERVVNESGWRQRVISRLAAHIASRQLPQFAVNRLNQPRPGAIVAFVQRDEQACDVASLAHAFL